MRNEYKSAMDKITADSEFKAQLMKRIALEEEKKNAPKANLVKSLRTPLVASLSSAAVLALLIYSSAVLVLPMLRNSEYEILTARPQKDIHYSHSYGERPRDFDADAEHGGEKAEAEAVTEDKGTAEKNHSADRHENGTDKKADGAETKGESRSQLPSLNDVDIDEQYSIITYSGEAPSALKGVGGGVEAVDYDCTLHFCFEGFADYGVGLKSNNVLFTATLPADYTLSEFFTDYYGIISARGGKTTVTDGMLDSFFDIPASGIRPISVYVDGAEAVNLDNILLSEFSSLSNVYFTVSVK